MTQRETWLERRRQGIGSSDAASVCGIEGAFSSPLGVWLDKLGRLRPTETPPMRWGKKLEDVVATAYEEETGRTCWDHDPFGIIQHPEYPWMLATLDYLAAGDGGDRIVELKTANAWDVKAWGEPGTDEIPEAYLLQVHHQMAVTGLQVADVPVLFGPHDFRIYTVERNEQLIRDLILIEADFWPFVERREPPEVDWSHPATPKLLEHLYRPDPALTITLSDTMAGFWEFYELWGAEIRDKQKARDQAKARILEEMGSAGVGLLPDGRQLVRKEVRVKEKVTPGYSYFGLRAKKARM